MRHNIKKIAAWLPWPLVCNLALLYACYMVCRAAFILDNLDILGPDLASASAWRIFVGGLRFDSSAIFYTNIPYLLLLLLPLHYKERQGYQKALKWIFVTVNSIALAANLCDTAYFPFSLKRTTLAILDEFGGNTNLGAVFGAELLGHWYLVLLMAAMACALACLYRYPAPLTGSLKSYYIRQSLTLVVAGALAVAGMRGAFFSTASRPIAMSNAYEYVEQPSLTAAVLNTPFSLIRTSAIRKLPIPEFYTSEEELAAWYSPLHQPSDSAASRKNVVILIVESFAEEFVGARNTDLDGGTYRGYTPFVDSLLRESVTFERTYSNGWLSIDAMPSVLSSLPKMYNSFIVTPYAVSDVPGLARELGAWGYSTAFFHGAENTSMGFQAFARSAGFDEYYGRTEYDADPLTGGERDYDGTWAIWDEEFLQFFCRKISEMPQPFLASVFTASSHHPFNVPERYKDVFTDEGKYPLHKCIRYTDNALRLFFEAAKRQPWYDNTIFVLTADHASSRITHDVYRTAIGDFRVPILFFDPSGSLAPGTRPGIAQQIDIMPSLLSLLGYDKPYIAFGKDLFNGEAGSSWAFNWHNIPQYVKGDYLLQYNGFEVSGIYNIAVDPLLKDNLAGTDRYDKEAIDRMEHELRAILQETDTRIRTNKMTL